MTTSYPSTRVDGPAARHTAARRWGGKAAVLLELQEAGFAVPAFEVSPACVESAVRRLKAPLVVRSSACAEDGTQLSFAGQFQSYLHLFSTDQVTHAIKRCHDSVHDPGVTAYCQQHGISSSELTMHVIVQRMIEPELAGVAFTVNPVTGCEEIVIEACAGLADDLLAGKVDSLPTDDPLMQKYRPEIERIARQVQLHFGTPQDIEFAVEGGTVYLLQARPITRIGFANVQEQWTNADFRDGGVSSTVCSPLMWSLYEYVWDRSLKDTLRELKLFRGEFEASRCFFGRPYWNLAAVKESLAVLPGYRERDFDEDLSVQINYDGFGQTTPITLRNLLRALPTVFAIPRFLKQQIRATGELLAVPQEERWQQVDPNACHKAEAFAQLIHHSYLPVEYTYFRTIFASSLAKIDFLGAFPDADYIGLVSGLPPLRHMAPIRLVQDSSDRSDAFFSSLIDQYGYHYCRGLDVIEPRWDEEPAFVKGMLDAIRARTDTDAVRNPQQAYELTLQATLRDIPRRNHRRFLTKLARLRQLLWLREELRDVSSYGYHRLRQCALAIARQRGLGDGVFFQTFQDVIQDDRSRIDERRQNYVSYRNFQAPNEIGGRFRFQSSCKSGQLHGIAASPGTVTGKAFVCRNVEEAAQMPDGSILVCPFTDPGWTAVLGRAAGVITETGGLLSHAAILCREYGIPAVLGIPQATQRIAHACQLDLNGNTGRAAITS
ncbi:MAG: hypothetical protein KDB23_05210 [Planctomycetales bacterium]|nr:hypothetical protein [Planctomycetales bacterium]